MRFLIMTDIEGVSGITTFQQAENSDFGHRMLMHDLMAVIKGIKKDENHQIVIYDMHTDGRNVDLEILRSYECSKEIPVVMGKPINRQLYKGTDGKFDGLFLLGLHSMQNVKDALLAHSYLREYESIHINGNLFGEIGIEALLAGEQNIPLVFVSGDDVGCAEAKKINKDLVTAVVKESIGETQSLCYSLSDTENILMEAAAEAASKAKEIKPIRPSENIKIEIKFSTCKYLNVMKSLYPDFFIDEYTFVLEDKGMLNTWSKYLLMEKEMIEKSKIS